MIRTSSERRSSTKASGATSREVDALVLLTRDHDAIKCLFRDYQRLVEQHGDDDTQAEIVDRICGELSLHAQIEEELFYPAIRAAQGSALLIEHSLHDHACARELIAQIDEMAPGDARCDALVATLRANIVPHMNHEQTGIFRWVRMAGLDTAALGRQMVERQRTLREDVTRLGLPRVNPGAVTWPLACHLGIA